MDRYQTEIAALLATDLDKYFCTFVTHYQSSVYAFLVRQTGHPHDAEDIAQEAFIQAYYALADYPKPRIQAMALKPWLFKIAINIFYKRMRLKRLAMIPLDTGADSEHTEIIDIDAEQPEIILLGQENLRELSVHLHSLPANYRDALNLYYFAQLSYQEIADLLNVPMGTVKSNLHRGIHLLRKLLLTRTGERESRYVRSKQAR